MHWPLAWRPYIIRHEPCLMFYFNLGAPDDPWWMRWFECYIVCRFNSGNPYRHYRFGPFSFRSYNI